jgi:hypothetical protein
VSGFPVKKKSFGVFRVSNEIKRWVTIFVNRRSCDREGRGNDVVE